MYEVSSALRGIFYFLAGVLFILVLVSCLGNVKNVTVPETVQAENVYEYDAPNFKRVSKIDNYYAYVVDKNTGLVYVLNTMNGGLSVVYNSDGNIMTEDDLHMTWVPEVIEEEK